MTSLHPSPAAAEIIVTHFQIHQGRLCHGQRGVVWGDTDFNCFLCHIVPMYLVHTAGRRDGL